jgi:hypothetical protein
MKGWKRTLTLLVALVLVNMVTFVVVRENQHSGLYPVDGDSIGIPIMSTLALSVLVLPLLVLIGLLPGAQFMVRLCARGLLWRIGVGFFLLVLYVVVALLAFDGAGYWAIPDHYSVASAYVASLLALALFFLFDTRWLLSNSAPHGDGREAPHLDQPSSAPARGRERYALPGRKRRDF